jgi:uncharacterized protein (DUF2062 family)
MPPLNVEFHATFEWLVASIDSVGKPFLVGSIIFAAFVSTAAWFLIDWCWIIAVRRAWRKRAEHHKKAD